MRPSIDDLDIAMTNLRRALDRFEATLSGARVVPANAGPSPEYQELQRREVIARTWPYDPRGLMARIGPVQYAAEHGL